MVKIYTIHPNKDYSRKDNFYGSDQSRLKTYTKDRRVEEHNGDVQQAKVYQRLAEERGDMETANRLAQMATSVINQFGQQVQSHTVPATQQISESPFDVRSYLKRAIESGTLSQVWDAIKRIPKSKLSPTAAVLQHDIKHNKMMKDIVNEKVLSYAQLMEKRAMDQHLVNNIGDLVDVGAINTRRGTQLGDLMTFKHPEVDSLGLQNVVHGVKQSMIEANKAAHVSGEVSSILNEIVETIAGTDDLAQAEFKKMIEIANASMSEAVSAHKDKFQTPAFPTSTQAPTEAGTEMAIAGKVYSDSEIKRFINMAIGNIVNGTPNARKNGLKALETWSEKRPDLANKRILKHSGKMKREYPRSKKLKVLISKIAE